MKILGPSKNCDIKRKVKKFTEKTKFYNFTV